MTTSGKVNQITDALSKFRQRISAIVQETSRSEDGTAGYERLFHLKTRVVRYLSENVSKVEAENLRKKGSKTVRSYIFLKDDARLFDSILLAIIEALEDNPAYVLEDLSPSNLIGSSTEERKDIRFENDVFVSYSSLDKEQANLIYNSIKKAGGTVFLAAKDLTPGQDFAEEIRKKLLSSKEIWLLVSPNSLKSEWVLTEWGAAWALQRNIIPILYRCSPQDLPERIKRLQCVDFHEHAELVKSRFKLSNK